MNPITPEIDRPHPLVIDNVTKRYGRGKPVIEALSLTAEPGAATGLVGPNGSGKTTLLRLLSVVSYPTSGRILYGDLDVHAHPHRYLQHVGIVHDSPELPQYLTAVELLEWMLRARGQYDASAPQRIAGLFDRLRLDERRENLIGTYSSGMVKKTQIAAALAARPAVLIMDEPFRGLDEASTEVAIAMLREFHEGGGIVILSSHVRSSLEAICDRYLYFPLGG